MWDNVAEVMDTFDRDDFVKVKGLLQLYQNRSQFTIHQLRRLEDHEVEFDDFFPVLGTRLRRRCSAELQGIIAGIGELRICESLLTAMFADEPICAEQYKMAPAAKSIHHACRGGLLEHVLSLCSCAGWWRRTIRTSIWICCSPAPSCTTSERLKSCRTTRSFNYSSDGQLLGHIIIGLRMLADKLAQLPDFPPKLRTLVEHMIISHHGELEFGSPKVPLFAEAMLLHHLDNLDSKMEAMRSALKRDPRMEGEFTGWVASLERESLLQEGRYLADSRVCPTARGSEPAGTDRAAFRPPPPGRRYPFRRRSRRR